MEWQITTEGIAAPVSLFSPEESFLCGQAFRFLPEDGGFTGTVGKRRVHMGTADGMLYIRGASIQDAPFWERYLSLDEDYAAIQRRLARNPVLRQAVAFAPGIRVLRQPFFETLLTFIISQNNNLGRIKGIVARLCGGFGDELSPGIHAFPRPEQLAGHTEEDLAPLRAGWRAGYLLDAAEKVASGELDLDEIARMPLDDARAALQIIRGVGPKVAECALLYGFGRRECFPMDVWMKRAMKQLFPKGLPRCARADAGIAQQYIFHYARVCPEAFDKK